MIKLSYVALGPERPAFHPQTVSPSRVHTPIAGNEAAGGTGRRC